MTRLLTANDVPGKYPPSWYTATAKLLPPFPTVEGEVSCDVCVVGGGYTGLSAALHLAERGFDTVLLDAHRVGWGASGRNGGQVGSGQRRPQDELERRFGRERAHQLWALGEAAKALVKDLIARHDIDCDLKPGIVYADHKRRYVAHSHRYVEKLRRDYDYALIEPLSESDIREQLGTRDYYGGAFDRGAAHLHPLNYALGLARAARAAGARIFERSAVNDYDSAGRCRVHCARGQVSSEFLVLACNGYLDGLDTWLARRTMPINNFIIATEPLGEARARELIRDDVAVADSRFVVNYFRRTGDSRLLFGGGESYGYHFPKDIARFVRPHLLKIYPQLDDARIDFGWGGTLAITVGRLPCFARLAPNVLTAAGYSGQGVALATLAGQILAESVAGTAERMDLMSRIPSPAFPGGRWLRWPLLVLAMTWYSLRDRF